MPPPPQNIFLYHITAIPNLPGIVAQQALRSKGWLTNNRFDYSDIAYQGAQGRRATKVVPHLPGGVIHDYVPFYFAPRSPMLFTINNGNVPGCTHGQDDIVHIVFTLDAIVQAGLPFVFYDYNATLGIATCYNDLADLDKIDWPLFFEAPCLGGYCKYWKSDMDKPRYATRMETRQAELMVHESVPLAHASGIGTYDAAKAAQVKAILDGAEIELPVEAKAEWYY